MRRQRIFASGNTGCRGWPLAVYRKSRGYNGRTGSFLKTEPEEGDSFRSERVGRDYVGRLVPLSVQFALGYRLYPRGFSARVCRKLCAGQADCDVPPPIASPKPPKGKSSSVRMEVERSLATASIRERIRVHPFPRRLRYRPTCVLKETSSYTAASGTWNLFSCFSFTFLRANCIDCGRCWIYAISMLSRKFRRSQKLQESILSANSFDNHSSYDLYIYVNSSGSSFKSITCISISSPGNF